MNLKKTPELWGCSKFTPRYDFFGNSSLPEAHAGLGREVWTHQVPDA